MRFSAVLVALGLFAGSLGAQSHGGAVDVHVLRLSTPAGELIPTAEIVLSTRLTVGGTDHARTAFVRIGRMRVGAAVNLEEGGGVRIEREISEGSTWDSGAGRTLDVTEPYRWGRRPRHGSHERGALLCEPIADGASPFVPIDVRGFMRRVVDVLFEPEDAPRTRGGHVSHQFRHHFRSPRWKAALVLGSVPLRAHLEQDQIDRILAAGARVAQTDDDEEWALLRPLIALADRRILEARARIPDEPAEVRDGSADRAHPLVPHVPRTIEDSVLVAYASSTDPEIRGLAGWLALGTRSRQVYDLLADDVKTGRAVLPGDEAQRATLAEHIMHLRAWQSITAPALALVASALSVAGIMMLLRSSVRRMF